ncbi:Dihydroorotate dehydrogenase B (NAD(+)), catalytic subunit [Sedimentisphaera cyanobacteriorum]|uniref:Dihydroorotate dehydrogenase n=1 Tax=Sedimentisphaera cyanobacteriorum TaxID=1940790 RepID=A0A1Q2HS37_9BACT|nr:dihydroorotate dehydrogenase [Sedimentisphaera cyanobacteriorum]AQQ10278.1 Dihydroorotate dehydrogenase B (NAD(+)), catalytic subunit [Sedimentisphaera cyanobacteriorum]
MSIVNEKIEFAGLNLKNPVFTASGTCGYIDELDDYLDVNQLGGWITKSITLKPRLGNPAPRVVETNGGMLNAIGLANIGLEEFIAEKLPIIRQKNTAVFVNLAGQKIDEYVEVASRLSGQDGISGFELNISCPNVKQGGISFGTDPAQIKKITSEVKPACGGKPLMVKLTPSVTDISKTAEAAVLGGADALSLVNTFTAMVIDVHTRTPVLANRTGGLSGPAIKPMAVYLVSRVYQDVAKDAGIPIMGLGGIRNGLDAAEFMIAGASTVCIGTATFARPDAAVKVSDGLRRFCESEGIKKISELTGSLN